LLINTELKCIGCNRLTTNKQGSYASSVLNAAEKLLLSYCRHFTFMRCNDCQLYFGHQPLIVVHVLYLYKSINFRSVVVSKTSLIERYVTYNHPVTQLVQSDCTEPTRSTNWPISCQAAWNGSRTSSVWRTVCPETARRRRTRSGTLHTINAQQFRYCDT